MEEEKNADNTNYLHYILLKTHTLQYIYNII